MEISGEEMRKKLDKLLREMRSCLRDLYFHGNRGCVMEELEVTLNTDFTQCNFCR